MLGRPYALTLSFAPLLLAVGQYALAEPYAPQVGQRHEGFTLPTISDGQPVSLSDLRGKKVLLVHFASW